MWISIIGQLRAYRIKPKCTELKMPETNSPNQSGARLIELSGIYYDEGFSWIASLPLWVPSGDSPEDSTKSGVRLFEDGQELLQAHCSHADIRSLGGGRFSHWGRKVWFSASDNVSPVESGRRYSLLIPSATPQGALREAIDQIAMVKRSGVPLDGAQVHAFAKALVRQVYPEYVFSDYGRCVDWDAAFRREFERFLPSDNSTFDRKYAVYELAKLMDGVPGHAAEVGCYNGCTSFFIAKQIKNLGVRRELHLFDSFQGLSCPDAVDGAYWNKGDLACDELTVRRNLADVPDLHIHAGWVPDCFAAAAERRFAFVHIDVDLWQPTYDSLVFFYPRLERGGVMVFDDYGFPSCPGATKAIDAFFADKREKLINLSGGGAFIMKQM